MNEYILIEPFVHSLQHSCEVEGEKSWNFHALLLHAMVEYKGITGFTADRDLYHHFIVELLDDVYKLIRASIDFFQCVVRSTVSNVFMQSIKTTYNG